MFNKLLLVIGITLFLFGFVLLDLFPYNLIIMSISGVILAYYNYRIEMG